MVYHTSKDQVIVKIRKNVGLSRDYIITSYGIGGKEHAFTKEIEAIQAGEYTLRNIQLDFTSFRYHSINGLLGLDILINGKFNIDLDKPELLGLQ